MNDSEKYSPLIQVNITVSQPKQEHFGSHHFYQTAKGGDIFWKNYVHPIRRVPKAWNIKVN